MQVIYGDISPLSGRGFPQFKSKQAKQSLQYPQNIKIIERAIYLPKIGTIKANLHRLFDGKLKTVTVTKTKTGKYYTFLLFENDAPEKSPSNQGKTLGIEPGLIHFAVISNGSKFENPRHLKRHQRNLKRKQLHLSRRQKGSRSREKARHT